MKLKLTADGLAYTLLGEMQEVMGLMEAGDYDTAYRILEARCRPNNPMMKLPDGGGDLGFRRALVDMLKLIPRSLLCSHYRHSLEGAARIVAIAHDVPGWIDSGENALTASMLLAQWGLSFQCDYESDGEHTAAMETASEVDGQR